MNNGLLEIFSYIILFIYTIFTIGNLYMILQKKTTERNFFNVFLMPLLALFYLLRFKNHNILIYLAIFSFWIGDILLTKKNKRNVILGLSLSCIGMILYVIKLITFIKIINLNYLLTILIMILYFGLVFFEVIISYEYASEYFKKDIIFLYIIAFLNALLCILLDFKFTIFLCIIYKKQQIFQYLYHIYLCNCKTAFNNRIRTIFNING